MKLNRISNKKYIGRQNAKNILSTLRTVDLEIRLNSPSKLEFTLSFVGVSSALTS